LFTSGSLLVFPRICSFFFLPLCVSPKFICTNSPFLALVFPRIDGMCVHSFVSSFESLLASRPRPLPLSLHGASFCLIYGPFLLVLLHSRIDVVHDLVHLGSPDLGRVFRNLLRLALRSALCLLQTNFLFCHD